MSCNPLLDTSSVGFPSLPKTASRKVITGADVTCDVNVTSGLLLKFYFFFSPTESFQSVYWYLRHMGLWWPFQAFP